MFVDKLHFETAMEKSPLMLTNLTKNFSWKEMQCKCGCGKADMDDDFMDLLQRLRDHVGPLKISSGFRCEEYNKLVSSTGSNGPHTTGKAADIFCSGELANRVFGEAYPLGFTGFGFSQKGNHNERFIHLDTLQNTETKGSRPWSWTY